jgi:hypothetical protein
VILACICCFLLLQSGAHIVVFIMNARFMHLNLACLKDGFKFETRCCLQATAMTVQRGAGTTCLRSRCVLANDVASIPEECINHTRSTRKGTHRALSQWLCLQTIPRLPHLRTLPRATKEVMTAATMVATLTLATRSSAPLS